MVAMKDGSQIYSLVTVQWQIITDFHAQAWYLGAGFRSACVLPSLYQMQMKYEHLLHDVQKQPRNTIFTTFPNKAQQLLLRWPTELVKV